MIAIIDNGVGYSDHAIWFFEAASGDEAREFLDVLKAVKLYWGQDAKILATAQSITWWHGGARTFDAFLEEHAWEILGPNAEDLPRFDVLSLTWLARIERATREAWDPKAEPEWHGYLARRRAAALAPGIVEP